MTADADPIDDEPQKSGKGGMILGLILAVVGAGGGFAAVQMGLIGGGATADGDDHAAAGAYDEHDEAAPAITPLSPGTFLPLDTIVVNLPNSSGHALLRFTAHLEVAPAYVEDVTGITPRIVDVLNSYLRAVDVVDLDDPSALVRLRSQMLRRVQVVTGNGRVTDLLITEFVLN